MNLESMPRPETIHVTAPAALSRPMLNSQTLPQRSPFAIQELLGLSESSRNNASSNNTNTSNTTSNSSNSGNGPVSAVTPSLYSNVGQTPFGGSDHHQMTMAASRMAYFNAHAAVAAAFLPHNIPGAGSHLGFHSQASGKSNQFHFIGAIFIKFIDILFDYLEFCYLQEEALKIKRSSTKENH